MGNGEAVLVGGEEELGAMCVRSDEDLHVIFRGQCPEGQVWIRTARQAEFIADELAVKAIAIQLQRDVAILRGLKNHSGTFNGRALPCAAAMGEDVRMREGGEPATLHCLNCMTGIA